MLRQQGHDPDRVGSPEAAWPVFRAFLAMDLDGLETSEGTDADGFAISWGRYSWNDDLPSLSFERYMAVDVPADWTETEWYQPEYWRLDLDMIFADSPAFSDIDKLNTQDSGIYYERSRPAMETALREALWEIEQHPTLRALWTSTPMRSTIDLERND
ncbi:MAG: hypothetical protein HOU81_25480 [Hamadaea sp.]|nr:hypothetical protein [Hamadaea sp.]NUT20501.1 hypothetical protein [Hamadaea sp.]